MVGGKQCRGDGGRVRRLQAEGGGVDNQVRILHGGIETGSIVLVGRQAVGGPFQPVFVNEKGTQPVFKLLKLFFRSSAVTSSKPILPPTWKKKPSFPPWKTEFTKNVMILSWK